MNIGTGRQQGDYWVKQHNYARRKSVIEGQKEIQMQTQIKD